MIWYSPTPNPSPASATGEFVRGGSMSIHGLNDRHTFSDNLSTESPHSRTAGKGPGVGA
jgi:hypothetical protein